jgi:deoxyhypusine synthase
MECDVPVRQVHLQPGMSVKDLIIRMEQAGAYNGGALSRAVQINSTMFRRNKLPVFLVLQVQWSPQVWVVLYQIS